MTTLWGRWMLAAALAATAVAAGAEPLTGREADRALFEPRDRVILKSERLDARNGALVDALVPLMEQQLNARLQYYGAIAFSPDEGFQAEASQSALNHHSPAAADRAALAACNARRAAAASGCVIAARILPPGYRPRDFTLSVSASEAMRRVYPRTAAPKALAISPLTGAFAIGSPAEVVALCNRDAGGAGDCMMVVRD